MKNKISLLFAVRLLPNPFTSSLIWEYTSGRRPTSVKFAVPLLTITTHHYCCGICGKSFSRNSLWWKTEYVLRLQYDFCWIHQPWTSYEITHWGKVLYLLVCSKAFIQTLHIKGHHNIRMHTGESPTSWELRQESQESCKKKDKRGPVDSDLVPAC